MTDARHSLKNKVRDKVRNLFGVKPKGEMTMELKVIRADGTVEDLGVVSKGSVNLETRSN